ncbi:MAG TPA: phosphotransferase [Solirubrobacteraceae bacterium]|jgi:trehalose synthase-fused probable maltokinase|nr:phosphotransferase [Solirubrobacteraceae bacterium]
MSQPVESPVEALLGKLDLQAVAAWLEEQRWYASKSRHVAGLEVEEAVALADDPPLLLALVQARFATGSHDLYQLPLAFLSPAQGQTGLPVARTRQWTAVDAVADPELVRELLRHIDAETAIDTGEGCVRFAKPDPSGPLNPDAPARPMGVEQSNSSIVFGDETVLKVFRRLEPGINPELEMLRFLTRQEFPHIAPLQGWYEYESRTFSATLGVAQRFFPNAVGGWELALDQIRTDPAAFLMHLASLGTVTAEMHNTLASDANDPAFSPEEPSAEALALLTATIDEDIERAFVRLPDDERVASIAGRGQDVRERIATRAQLGVGGRAIRTHGDYHLGQTLHLPGGRGWLIIDFEGEPARPLYERRFKASPLRDVAGMLRSFAYATSAVAIMYSHPAPGQFEDRARETFLNHYFATIDPALLPAGESAIINLLSIFELEKAIYELQYELDNRPDWLPIPVSGIARLLESE